MPFPSHSLSLGAGSWLVCVDVRFLSTMNSRGISVIEIVQSSLCFHASLNSSKWSCGVIDTFLIFFFFFFLCLNLKICESTNAGPRGRGKNIHTRVLSDTVNVISMKLCTLVALTGL